MRDINKFFGIGRLTADPELRTVSGDLARCTFAIAMNRYARDQADEQVTYLNVTSWKKLAETCASYLSKGNRVAVLGWLKSSRYIGKNDEPRNRMEVVAESVQFLEAARREESSRLTGRRLFC